MGAQARRQRLLELLAPAVFRDKDVVPRVLEDTVSWAGQAVGISHKRGLYFSYFWPKVVLQLVPNVLGSHKFCQERHARENVLAGMLWMGKLTGHEREGYFDLLRDLVR